MAVVLKRSKRYKKAAEKAVAQPVPVEQAVAAVKAFPPTKFDQSVELIFSLGIDAKQADQMIRGSVVLPAGTGKKVRVLAFAQGEKAREAEEAGADYVGGEDLAKRIQEGWTDFDVAVATPDMMGLVGKDLGRILGPRMPNPKAGTVAPDPVKAVQELKSGKVQYRADKLGIIHSPIGKVSFDAEKLSDNLRVLLDAVVRARPATAKGTYLKSIALTNTMGPAVLIDPTKAAAKTAVTK